MQLQYLFEICFVPLNVNSCGFFYSYYEYLWLRNKGVDASSLFEGLPLSLQADISLSLYKDLIERVKNSSLFAFIFYLGSYHV